MNIELPRYPWHKCHRQSVIRELAIIFVVYNDNDVLISQLTIIAAYVNTCSGSQYGESNGILDTFTVMDRL